MTNAPQKFTYWFNGEGPSSVEIDGRKIHYRSVGELHTETFRTSAAAISRYEGDLRAMRRNPSYTFDERGSDLSAAMFGEMVRI